ncbi:MAG: hypothetical protein LBS19_12665, partial [Clostridiales bacterium]|nr:hypothetical protein [Clostridiales bacterium]
MFSTRTRITGMSGFDTQSMVNSLMQAESYKYDRLLKKATYTTYQQASYRSAATVMKGFQDKFLGVGTSLANSLRMPSAFNTGKATVTVGGVANNGISATATTASEAGSYKLTVKQIARKD